MPGTGQIRTLAVAPIGEGESAQRRFVGNSGDCASLRCFGSWRMDQGALYGISGKHCDLCDLLIRTIVGTHALK